MFSSWPFILLQNVTLGYSLTSCYTSHLAHGMISTGHPLKGSVTTELDCLHLYTRPICLTMKPTLQEWSCNLIQSPDNSQMHFIRITPHVFKTGL